MKKYQKQLKNNLRFLGNVPVKIFNSYLDDYYAKENDLTTLTVGIIASGIISLRKFATSQHSKELSNMIGNWSIIIVAYLISLVVIEIIIQSEKNTIYNQLTLINKKIKSLKEDKGNEKLVGK